MQSETQTVREDRSAHHCPAKVRHQAAIDTTHSVAEDFKTFRIAVVIGLVMVGGLSLFLPDKTAGPRYKVMAPASLESLDLAQHASTDSERTQTNIVEQRADRPRATPVVGTPPLQTDTMIDRLKSQVGFRGPARQVDAVTLQRSIPWK